MVAQSHADTEMMDMLSWVATSIGLEWNPPLSPEPSRLDDQFLGTGLRPRARPAPIPFFPEVHEELTRLWEAPFTARSQSFSSPALATLDGRAARGYSVTWRGHPRLPSRACRFMSSLTARAYGAAGQAVSALHAMALLQVHQAKALKELHEGSSDPGLMQELRSATDLALQATKVTARSLRQAMSTLVVQEHHLWLNLVEMGEVDKARFLDAPISQVGLFGNTVEDFAQQFSAVKKQTEVLQHILPWRGLRPRTLSARHQGHLPPATIPAPPQPVPMAGSRCYPSRGRPVEGREENILSPQPPGHAAPKSLTKEWFPCLLGHKQAHTGLVPVDYGDEIPPPPSSANLMVGGRSQVSASMSLDSARPWGSSPLDVAPRAPLRREAPPAGTSNVIIPLVPLARSLGTCLALSNPSRWLTRTVTYSAYVIQFTRCPPRFSGIRFTMVKGENATTLHAEIATLLRKGVIEPVPPAEMKKGFYSPYFIVPKKGGGLRPILDLRVLNRALHRLPFKMLTQKRILASVRHQDWFAAVDLKDAHFHASVLPRRRPFLRFAFEGQAYQYKVLPFGLSLSPCIFTKVAEAALALLREMGICILNYLDDWLILTHFRELLQNLFALGMLS
ncbi:uncharacterized protein LOC127447349 [Myxocyprinus asiaticus]|uniref:uncharacterized protein LOC127447349 n=1 Tax=Myxocyprinus asiaticus TaxID=70543 RepID=UPI002223C17F|nr:uncharacterized protein LOC127447349 [Myxocyprinus asiaticus]